MAAIFDRNSEQGFVFASLMEFFQCWSSKHEATLSIQCKQGRASLNFTCSLGEPDQQHVEVKKVFKRKKKKSPSQINRDNSRAAARRAREETGQPIPPNSHSSSPEREPEKNNQDRSPPSALAGQEDSPMDSAWQPSELDDTRAAEYATVPLSPGSPERETLSFDTPARLVRQDEFREETGARTDDYSESPHPEVTRAEVDISRHPTSPLSSPREETGRPEDSKPNHSSDSSSESESGDISCPPGSPPPSLGEETGRQEDDEYDSSPDSRDSSEDPLDGLDLQRFRAVKLCTLGPPHSCEEYWSSSTEEEYNLMSRWEDQLNNQLPAGEKLRPDLEDGPYPTSFNCSLLNEIRRFLMLREFRRYRDYCNVYM